MRLQPRDEPGELLYRFYKKWVTSFIETIFKAGITAGNKDIHESRVFLKKIFALLSFFEVLEASGFRFGKYAKLFRSIFQAAGNVREIQVNLVLVRNYRHSCPEGAETLLKYLEKDLRTAIRAFTTAITGFPAAKLQKSQKAVKEYCQDLDPEVISEKSQEFLLSGAMKIGYLAEHSRDESDIHRIRKELKKMKAVATLLSQIEPGRERGNLINKLEKAEIMIGEWHDMIVLAEYIEKSGQKTVPATGDILITLQTMKETIQAQGSEKLVLVRPLIKEIHDHFYKSK